MDKVRFVFCAAFVLFSFIVGLVLPYKNRGSKILYLKIFFYCIWQKLAYWFNHDIHLKKLVVFLFVDISDLYFCCRPETEWQNVGQHIWRYRCLVHLSVRHLLAFEERSDKLFGYQITLLSILIARSDQNWFPFSISICNFFGI